MPTVIVLTDFTATSRNALQYACHFLPTGTDILLMHIYATPFSYSGDGVALVALSEALETNQTDLEAELEWANEQFPAHTVRFKEIMGELKEVLEEQCHEEQAALVILGIPTDGAQAPLWESNTLSLLTNLSAPVLAIPPQAAFTPIKHIAFACKPENIQSLTPMDTVEKLIGFSGAQLHVVRVVTPGTDEQVIKAGEQLLREKLGNIHALYYTVEGDNIIEQISHFIREHQIDVLLIRPKKHGIWYKLFHKNYARLLAALDMVPVMSLYGYNES